MRQPVFCVQPLRFNGCKWVQWVPPLDSLRKFADASLDKLRTSSVAEGKVAPVHLGILFWRLAFWEEENAVSLLLLTILIKQHFVLFTTAPPFPL